MHNHNHTISYMQMLMNDQIENLLKDPLYSSSQFDIIYKHISHNVDQVPLEDCPSLLISLLFSGLEQTDSLTRKLLARCHKAMPLLNIANLREMTHVLQCQQNRDFVLSEKIVQRLQEILRANPLDIDFDIQDLIFINPILASYMSQDMVDKCATAVLLKIKDGFEELDIDTIGGCFRYVRKMSHRSDREILSEIRDLAKMALDRFKDYSMLQSYHIAEVCHNAKRLGCYTEPIVSRIQDRSLALLRGQKGSVRIKDITNLLFAFTRSTSPIVKQELIMLLEEHMDDADVLILSNVADNIYELGLHDPALITLFQWKVLQNIDHISQYITRLVKVLRLLRERMENDPAFNQQLAEVLLKVLNHRQGFDPAFVVVASQFVLPSVHTVVPTILMECLLNAIPRCGLSLTLLVLNTLEKMKGPWSRSLHNQVMEIRSSVQANIGEKLDNATQASELAQLIKGLHFKSQQKDFALLDRMMEIYPTLTKSMSRQDYLKTVHVFRRLSHPYYHPAVFDDLMVYAKENYSEIGFNGFLDLVNILANAGYRPSDFDEFSNFAVQILEDTAEEENYIGEVTLAFYLSLLQIFPDSILGRIFTFDFLEEIDSIIETEPDRQPFLKNLVMNLNRSVILECPHLDVPWFHDQYCQDISKTSGDKVFQKNRVFGQEMEDAVLEVMGLQQYMGHQVYSPYYHPIDFEVVLDGMGQPVTNATGRLISPHDAGYHRVALQLVSNQQLCANSQRRRGQFLRDRRHLEILGYRVEEVPRYEWNSMVLQDWTAKVNYVRQKIFQDGLKDQKKIFSSPP